MHDWSDDSFPWEKLNDGIDMISSFMHFWGRIGVNSKEKFGTARVYVAFWDGSLHGLLYPGYASSQFPKWLWKFDLNVIAPFTRFVRVQQLVYWWQRKVYSWAYSKALKHFPEVKIELVIAADFEDLIKEHEAIMTMYRFRQVIKMLMWKDEPEEDE